MKRIFYILFIVVLIAAPVYFISQSLTKQASVQVGQTWLFEWDGGKPDGNPFKEPRKASRWTVTVVDIKDGFVQYEYNHHDGLGSDSIKKFVVVFDLVPDPNEVSK